MASSVELKTLRRLGRATAPIGGRACCVFNFTSYFNPLFVITPRSDAVSRHMQKRDKLRPVVSRGCNDKEHEPLVIRGARRAVVPSRRFVRATVLSLSLSAIGTAPLGFWRRQRHGKAAPAPLGQSNMRKTLDTIVGLQLG